MSVAVSEEEEQSYPQYHYYLLLISSIHIPHCLKRAKVYRIVLAQLLLINTFVRAMIFLNIFRVIDAANPFRFFSIIAVLNMEQISRSWLNQGEAHRQRNSYNKTWYYEDKN